MTVLKSALAYTILDHVNFFKQIFFLFNSNFTMRSVLQLLYATLVFQYKNQRKSYITVAHL